MQNHIRIKWIVTAVVIGILSGIASAIFLLSLEKATVYREQHEILIWLLPLGGFVIGWIYHTLGKSVEGGNNLVIEEFHKTRAVLPFRMAPLVLLGTVMTHFFGGSAGREGTAIQMGASIADQFTGWFKFSREDRRRLLMIGMSGGFGSVFGVPFAGTIFGMESLAIRRLHLYAIVECAIASFVAHHVTISLGVHHPFYGRPLLPEFSAINVLLIVLSGVAFGAAARLFSWLTHGISHAFKRWIFYAPLRPALGGAVIALAFWALGTDRYAGLGVPLILESIRHLMPIYDWFGKLVFTALTLGSGFKGGEVTPLLFIGSCLGNALAHFLPLPFSSLAAAGLVAVFAGAANTPLACTIMAGELFGPEMMAVAGLACYVSYLCSGHQGIYRTQELDWNKESYLASIFHYVRSHFSPTSRERDQ